MKTLRDLFSHVRQAPPSDVVLKSSPTIRNGIVLLDTLRLASIAHVARTVRDTRRAIFAIDTLVMVAHALDHDFSPATPLIFVFAAARRG